MGDRRGLFPDRADRSEANAEFKTMVSGRYLPGATAFHHMDIFIGTSILGARVNWLMELGGLAAIALPAMMVSNNKMERR